MRRDATGLYVLDDDGDKRPLDGRFSNGLARQQDEQLVTTPDHVHVQGWPSADRVEFVEPQVAAGYPDGNPKTALGLAKPGVRFVPPVAIFVMGQAMASGAEKYGAFNWREHNVTASVYYDAALRHLMAWHDGEDRADSGVDHLGHVMSCMAILLDAKACGKMNDDRGPFAGPLPAFLL